MTPREGSTPPVRAPPAWRRDLLAEQAECPRTSGALDFVFDVLFCRSDDAGGRAGCELVRQAVRLLGIERADMGMQQVTQHQRMVSCDHNGRVTADACPHPAVLANVPLRGITDVVRMIEVRDAADRLGLPGSAGRQRAAVVDPAIGAAEQVRLAGLAVAAGDLPTAEVNRDALR